MDTKMLTEARLAWVLEEIELLREYVNMGFDNDPNAFSDDYFIAHAIMLFSLEQEFIVKEPATPEQKAAFAIYQRLSSYPDMAKEGRVSFPFLANFADKNKPVTRREIAAYRNAEAVMRKVETGAKITSAFAQVATEINKSPQKVTKDYYRWREALKGGDDEPEALSDLMERVEDFYKNLFKKIE